ncbi:hypothetical protein GLOTRDRAFT_130850 [Gloeophyllum trabeum ATCC 11539]|uniref:Uncharacterized protein n=1 Tax=Gloeophyllum trabeum (strain ATCC 11539 / FP-39264 / Madison 617) TaxID=670483 RepID=S7Q1X1_GLOTA|nr:uncharacterized protein GLOTRDRAFT_130850 [Gloeophyllum trabeum ATCC 11539]EPQ53507.1 hypothetical protein GLOTRDRAFT_130850 [Gloeophyllum trabeum ATCC 11539]
MSAPLFYASPSPEPADVPKTVRLPRTGGDARATARGIFRDVDPRSQEYKPRQARRPLPSPTRPNPGAVLFWPSHKSRPKPSEAVSGHASHRQSFHKRREEKRIKEVRSPRKQMKVPTGKELAATAALLGEKKPLPVCRPSVGDCLDNHESTSAFGEPVLLTPQKRRERPASPMKVDSPTKRTGVFPTYVCSSTEKKSVTTPAAKSDKPLTIKKPFFSVVETSANYRVSPH